MGQSELGIFRPEYVANVQSIPRSEAVCPPLRILRENGERISDAEVQGSDSLGLGGSTLTNRKWPHPAELFFAGPKFLP